MAYWVKVYLNETLVAEEVLKRQGLSLSQVFELGVVAESAQLMVVL